MAIDISKGLYRAVLAITATANRVLTFPDTTDTVAVTADITAHAATPHGGSAVHVLATGTALGPEHTVSGAAAGEVLRALSATTAAFDVLGLNDVGAASADYSINTNKLTNVKDPTAAQDAATKAYVDTVASGLSPKASVRLATAAALPALLYSNGASGVGATLTAVAIGVLTIDGTTVALGDRLLIKDQVTGLQNGIYTCTTAGAAGVAFILTRATDTDTSAEIFGSFVFVETGTVNFSAGFVNANATAPTMGTDAITFTQFSGAGEITSGAGLTKTGNTLDAVGTANRITVNADSIDIASTYVGQASLTTLGTIATGVWQGTAVAAAFIGSHPAAQHTDRTRSFYIPISDFIAAVGTPVIGRVGTAGAGAKATAWAFDGTALERIGAGIVVIPADALPTTAFTATLYWAPSDANAGNVEWGFGYAFLASGDQIDEVEAGLAVNTITATPAVADQLTISVMAATNAKASGDVLLRCTVFRRADLVTDTYDAHDAWLVGVKIEYTADM